jgi:2-C-methyl-D-erythritol 2,4-cyclodiphosphate synthase
VTGGAPLRAGIGFDTHRLEAGRRLVLGGVHIDDAPHGLAGHSDADVLTHAIIDALLGAAGLGDIGQHFPDTDERWRDADSLELLRAAVQELGDAGYRPANIDATVACEEPKLGPFRDDMRTHLAEATGLEAGAVNVKFTTGERMGFVGRGEGIAALAIATVDRA